MRPRPWDICAFGDLPLTGLRTSRSTFEIKIVLAADLKPNAFRQFGVAGSAIATEAPY
jgi:hypothetical protein